MLRRGSDLRSITAAKHSMAKQAHSPAYLTWKKLKRNKMALAGLIFIALSVIIAILGYLVTPDPTPMANEIMLPVATRKPGFQTRILKIKKNVPVENAGFLTKLVSGKPSPYQLLPVS